MPPASLPASPLAHQPLAQEAELSAGPYRFVRERLRLPMGLEASFGWLRHPPTVLVVPRCADGRVLLLQRYRPAAGRWVLEFPSAVLGVDDSPEAAGVRLVRALTGLGCGGWRALGVLRPNPGYSDEHMTVGLLAMDEAGEGHSDPMDASDGGLCQLHRCAAHALETALSTPQEAVDGRCVTAWVLARPHWSV
ncbi:MAG: NUDIX hydrolase [Cyanobacteriota bacterium]|nr:NUDIX hydrolase [Cyanobacteriota bacterium]